ncbi:hypothetical protein ACA910_011743 [Epithemia clementina (nom. ined.)]
MATRMMMMAVTVVTGGSPQQRFFSIARATVVVRSLWLWLLLWIVGRPLVASASSSAAETETLIGIVGRDFILLGADSSLKSRSIALTATNVDKIALLTHPFPQQEQQLQQQPSQQQQPPLLEEEEPQPQQQDQPMKDTATTWKRIPFPPQQRQQGHYFPFQQQTIAAAVAGDTADADRLVGYLQAMATLAEYQAGVGCDVEEFVLAPTTMSSSTSTSTSTTTKTTIPTPPGPGLTVQSMAHLTRQVIYEQLRTTAPMQVNVLVAGMMPEQILHPRRRRTRRTTRHTDNDSFDDQEDDDGDDYDDDSISSRVRHQVRLALTSSTFPSSSTAPLQKEASDQQQQEQTHWPDRTPRDDSNSDDEEENDPSSVGEVVLQLRPHLYWLDNYGSLQRMKEYGVHGYASAFCWSILDQEYHPNMTVAQAQQLMQHCFEELRQRYAMNQHAAPPCIKCIDATGCRLL